MNDTAEANVTNITNARKVTVMVLPLDFVDNLRDGLKELPFKKAEPLLRGLAQANISEVEVKD